MNRFSVLAATFLFIFVACDDGSSSKDKTSLCGDNFKDFNEECDGRDLGGRTCQDFGYYGGVLSCGNSCLFDTSSCAAAGYCGDGIINGNEKCDGNELNQKTCASFGYLGGGELKCSDTCMFDTSECLGDGACGNGVVDSTEEECDGNDFAGQTCITMGYYGGILYCSSYCRIDKSECIAAGKCGDGIVHTAYNEQCDSDNLNGQTCKLLGYNDGVLACDSSCHFDVSSCEGTGTCGDGTVQSTYEECDGSFLGGNTCGSLGFYGGVLGCTDTCRYDLSSCRNSGWCGDGIRQSLYEECDMTAMNSASCVSMGYYGGTLRCSDNCEFDISGCERCGDGIRQSGIESCDGTALNGQTCESLGYYSGTLACGTDCGFDVSGCERCGDGIVQSAYEECDTDAFLITDCGDLGFQDGDIPDVCSDNCTVDTSVCKIKWSNFSVGAYHSCGIKTDGKLYCWGQNNYGRLGLGISSYAEFPQQIGDATDWNSIFAGKEYTCGIRSGKLYCWGYNYYGQLGLGTSYNNYYSPLRVGTDTDWSKVVLAYNHSCGIKTDGKLYCWGQNSFGQLGLGDTSEFYDTPQQVGDATDWVSVLAGCSHSCGIKTDGRLYCWGRNNYGQLGLGNTVEYHTPQQVGDATGWVSVTGYCGHNCGIKANGTLYCWGGNAHGQLGVGDTVSPYDTPQQVGDATDWSSISVGFYHTCGVKNNGELYCWGWNSHGQLGLGDTMDYDTPQRVGTDTDWVSVFSGTAHTCALKSGGRLYCWGGNDYHQLSFEDIVDIYYPERVLY